MTAWDQFLNTLFFSLAFYPILLLPSLSAGHVSQLKSSDGMHLCFLGAAAQLLMLLMKGQPSFGTGAHPVGGVFSNTGTWQSIWIIIFCHFWLTCQSTNILFYSKLLLLQLVQFFGWFSPGKFCLTRLKYKEIFQKVARFECRVILIISQQELHLFVLFISKRLAAYSLKSPGLILRMVNTPNFYPATLIILNICMALAARIYFRQTWNACSFVNSLCNFLYSELWKYTFSRSK